MQRVLNSLKNAAFFLLCYAPIPLMAGSFLIGDGLVLLMVQACLLPISVLISLLPGRVGGGSKKNDGNMVVRQSHGSDPDPDRMLRNEALPEQEKRSFPLRALVCLLAAIGVLLGVFFLPIEGLRNQQLWNQIIISLLMAVMLPLAVKVIATRSDSAGSVTAGMILYVIAGVTAYYTKNTVLERCLLICGTTFLVMTGLVVNNRSMAKGASVRAGVRPPAGMRRKNRALLIGFGLVACLVVYFDKIRQTVVDAFQWLGIKLWELLLFLTNLLAGGSAPVGDAGGGGGGMDMVGLLGGETGSFWAYTEQLLYVLAFLGGGAVVVWLLIQIYRLIATLVRRLIAHLKKFTSQVGEEYQDEQESLFDWGETKKELGDGLKKRLRQLTAREKKWEQMDARERVRFIVRSLYRKSPDSDALRALTVQEALKTVSTGQAQPRELADLYDEARYSQREPDGQTTERIRKEARV